MEEESSGRYLDVDDLRRGRAGHRGVTVARQAAARSEHGRAAREMKSALLVTLALAALPCAADPLLFVYFREPANMGVFFVTSEDGYHWTERNGGKPWLPAQYASELMRDPFVTRGPDGEFH